MTPIWIIMLSSIAAAIRTVAYGAYEWREKNKTGAIGVFTIAAVCFGVTVIAFTSILTNW